ncbi:MAG: NAD-dependent epimerase/dehydratase family protein [Pyrinomonadaceae bacterium]
MNSWRGRRCLITGGLGFIGSSLAIRLVELGARVTIVDSLLREHGGNLHNIEAIKSDVRLNLCDVRDEHVMAVLVQEADVVFHLAAQVSHVRSLSNPYPDIDINIKGTASVMEAIRKSRRDIKVIRTGTRGQYGPAVRLPVAEDAPTNPKGLYEISQLTAEKILQMYYASHGIPCVLLRLTNIYGPRAQMQSSHFGVANWLIRLALDGQPITIFGDGRILRDFVYIDDTVEAILRTASSEACVGEIINVGSDQPSSFLELAQAICRHVPGAELVFTEFTPERKAQEPGDFYSDIDKIRKLAGWQPSTPLDEGVRTTVEFYRRERANYW